MKKNPKILIAFLVTAFMAISAVSYAGGGGGGKGGGKGEGKSGGGEPSCKVVEKSTTLLIYNNFDIPSIRSSSWPTVPIPFPSPWTGAASASSLYDSPNGKYYCLVTVATNCKTWGESGVKTYVWNSTSNELKVNVPENMQFQISIEYYEPCGPYWTGGGNYGRGKWYSETTVGYSPIISFTQFIFVNKENC